MNLSPHFTLDEFVGSDTAARLGIDNTLPDHLVDTVRETCEMLERIRTHLGVPLIVTSGYRCAELNAAIGSSPTSDHIQGRAVDFKAPAFGTAFEIAQELAGVVDELEIGQLIHEFGSWVHVSTRRPDKRLNRVITISRRGVECGVQEA